MSNQVHEALDKALKGPLFDRRVRRRNLKDSLLGSGIKIGGVAIIAAVLLIMFFLIYVVGPLFTSAKVEEVNHYAVPGGKEAKTLYYGVDEYKSTALRFTQSGKLYGFNLQTGEATTEATLPLKGNTITSFSIISDVSDLLAFGLSDGSVLFAKYSYKVSYPNNVKTITPAVEFPFGSESITLAKGAITKLAVRANDSAVVIAFQEANSKNIHLKSLAKETSMFGDDVTLTEDTESVFEQQMMPDYLMLDGSMRNLYLVNQQGVINYYNVADLENPKLLQHINALSGDEKISSIRFLLGEYSLMMGTNEGRVYQYFPVRNADNIFQLQLIRQFEKSNSPIEMITIEQGRKGFATIDGTGRFDLFHSTSERHLESMEVDEKGLSFVTLAPRSNGALVETKDGHLKVFDIENEHPDVSMSSLWGKVWYEGYEEPGYTWQSSSASSDFEPKFSMVPLTFGTLKAALYSMLFAVPIAVLAAIYTAFFMDTKTRQWVKPSVELIEALPTVILGFLAGLWLAPHMEAHLSGYFAIILLVPLGVLLFGLAWSKLPEPIRLMVPEGKRAVLMMPVVVLLAYIALQLNSPIENLFFDGDMRHWLTASAGIDFDQRNALVIGFAMGFALIPTIFSVAEDAIYNVPSYLVNGSLALGASTWQTMVGVVLPTASPGIFSAIMLGFGRGVGETMIVLMASGNTPLMDANIFEGMRTLSANLAVEMAEAEVYSSHYRVLFLSGLVLFIFTFMFNTLAEVVRERMRRKYGSL
ncbi:ABC transporter permease subunit [Thiosulfativibrio zosterae]|uniref:Phosphate ABC transporter permease n=1 Tax=Thiosulfativibrio zosterae TaxID=2675053 RepID=A0A6F8PLL0_9GAMM|nr:ABC transporter permease subunit [Thiosulfativibrio zosterae]BBP42880.1 phosphate ABC transporter permease [Thiosulfativibrio zosterae]